MRIQGGNADTRRFYSKTLTGIIGKLDYIEDSVGSDKIARLP